MATNTEKRHVICSFQVLEDLHYADDLALLSVNGKQLQFKTNELICLQSWGTEVNKNTKKSKVVSVRTTTLQVISINEEEVDNVSTFTYFGSESARRAWLSHRKVAMGFC